MPRVISHAEVEAVPQGGALEIEPDTIVTPLARERADARGVRIEIAGEAQRAPLAEGGRARPPLFEGSQTTAQLVRQVTRQVVARLPKESPEVIEAVVAEILASLGPDSGMRRVAIGGPESPAVDVCAACFESERARARSRAVLTVTGRNQRGTAAAVTAALAELGADILDISQTLVADFFTMIVVFDTRPLDVPFEEARTRLEERMAALGMKATAMHEDVLSSLHRV